MIDTQKLRELMAFADAIEHHDRPDWDALELYRRLRDAAFHGKALSRDDRARLAECLRKPPPAASAPLPQAAMRDG
jgi:hypothetical protein